MRLIAKEIVPDSGLVVVRRGIRVAYARQSHELPAVGTVFEAFLSGFAEVLALRHELSEAQHAEAQSIAYERHHALAWLCGAGKSWADVTLDT